MKSPSPKKALRGDASLATSHAPGAESGPAPGTKKPQTSTSQAPSSFARSRRHSGHQWKSSNHDGSGYAAAQDLVAGDSLTTNKTTSVAPTPLTKEAAFAPTHMFRRRSTWHISIIALLTAAAGLVLLTTILRSLVTRQLDPKGCRMSYMRPSYHRYSEFDTEHTRFATKYSLYLYREQGVDDQEKLHGIPVLFIPGNAGSYKQVRPIAAEAANHFYHNLQQDGASVDRGVRNLDFFTVDFNEDITAFHGQTLLDQAEYLNEAVRFILSLYTDPTRASRHAELPDPTSVVVLGHSMGGIVARTMLVQTNYQPNSINTMITMSAPHARPPVTFDGEIVGLYDKINEYWRRAYTQKWANNNPLWHVTLVSIAGGSLDTVVPSDYASIESLVPSTHGFTVFTSGIPTVWTSMDHQAILWCDQFRKAVTRALFDIVDMNRAPQTKPRAERIRILRKSFLTGMESDVEQSLAQRRPATLLALDDDTSTIVPTGQRLVLRTLGSQDDPKVHLLPIPPQVQSERKRFTVLTDSVVGSSSEGGHLEVLLCSVSQAEDDSTGPFLSSILNLSAKAKESTKLSCKTMAEDVVLLPQSTSSTVYPFHAEGQRERRPFSHLQYDVDQLADHQFIAIVDNASSKTAKFVIAEFADHTNYHKSVDISLADLIASGLSIKVPAASRATLFSLEIPSLRSALMAYHLDVRSSCHQGQGLLAPLLRQHLERPFESKFFVNARDVSLSLHGVAPFMPPALESTGSHGLSLDLWVDPTCESDLEVTLTFDAVGSLGKLYMRYRTVFAAFPLLIVTLVLRKQFRVYDTTGSFISFSESLDLSLRRSIPLLLLSLTLLSTSMGGALALSGLFRFREAVPTPAWLARYRQNDLLIGTEDPFFCILVPVIGLVCTGVCAVLHCVVLTVTYLFGAIYGLFKTTLVRESDDHRRRSPSPTAPVIGFKPSDPRRRMITAAVLLFLVSTFIPYQFAYLVCCLVQLFTVIRAQRANHVSPSAVNSDFYHYAHSILLLMLWVLPINLPILAVWVRNLAVHWLTPFSSHHNVLSIMPFIFLVENLTTGRMVPRVEGGLRHVTSVLLFGTALCAAIFGVSHAYVLHHLVNIMAAWLAVVHSTSEPWTLSGFQAMFQGEPGPPPKSDSTH